MNTHLAWRKTVNVVMLGLTGLCAAIAVSALFFILGYLVYHGGSDVNWDFFTKLPTPDKQYNVIPGAAHAIGMSLTRADLWHVMHEFLTMPKTV